MGEKKMQGKLYGQLCAKYPEVFELHDNLGECLRKAGPLDEKTLQLVQLGAAVAARSEGATHSHARRAIQAGASEEEVYHALFSLISTIGFPQAMAGISWFRDILGEDLAG